MTVVFEEAALHNRLVLKSTGLVDDHAHVDQDAGCGEVVKTERSQQACVEDLGRSGYCWPRCCMRLCQVIRYDELQTLLVEV
jgi:hypothetical protein